MSHEPPLAFPVPEDQSLGDCQSPSARTLRGPWNEAVTHYETDDVSSCGTCPFSFVEWAEDDRHVDVACGHVRVAFLDRPRQIATLRAVAGEASSSVPPPTWCPLRESPTLVRLAPSEE